MSTARHNSYTRFSAYSVHDSLKSSKGFTLIEVFLVTMVLAVITGFTYAGFSQISKIQALEAAAKEVQSNIRYIQNKAINTVKPSVCIGTFNNYQVVFDMASNSYLEYVVCNNSARFLKTYNMPTGTKINDLKLDNSSVTLLRVYFLSNGKVQFRSFNSIDIKETPDTYVDVSLSSGSSVSYRLYIQPAGGVYLIKSAPATSSSVGTGSSGVTSSGSSGSTSGTTDGSTTRTPVGTASGGTTSTGTATSVPMINTSFTTMQIKTWLLKYHPSGSYYNVTGDPATFTKNTLLPALNEASKYHGYSNSSAIPSLNFTLADTDIHTENNPPPKQSGTFFSQNYNYAQLFSNYDLCNYAKANDIKAVMLWADGTGDYIGGFYESAITGNKGLPTNGAQLSYCPDKTIVVYGFNYTRGIAEALEAVGHHYEALFGYLQSTNYYDWSDRNSCGSDHNPPNSNFEYDRGNTSSFQSDCRRWHPNQVGAPETLSCSAWGCSADGWMTWWMQNMPGANNGLTTSAGVKVPNWWVYIGDPDRCYNQALSCSGML